MQYGEFTTISALKAWAPKLRADGHRIPRKLKKRMPCTFFYRGAIVCNAPGFGVRLSGLLDERPEADFYG